MKKILSLLGAVFLAGAAQASNTYLALVNGPLYTNATVIVGSVTNQNGVVLATSTNIFNLSPSYGSQANTNLWPAASWYMNGYPGTLSGPSRIQGLLTTGAFTATNAGGAQTFFLKYALSQDGVIWYTNALTVSYTAGANTTPIAPGITNWDCGAFPYAALQEIDNTNATAVTNLVVELGNKAGF